MDFLTSQLLSLPSISPDDHGKRIAQKRNACHRYSFCPPPLVITKAQIDEALEITREIFYSMSLIRTTLLHGLSPYDYYPKLAGNVASELKALKKITKNCCLGIFLKIRKTKSRNSAAHAVAAALTIIRLFRTSRLRVNLLI